MIAFKRRHANLSPLAYVRSHLVAVCFMLAASLLSYILPRQMGLDHDPALLIALCVACFSFVAGISNYLREKSFFDALASIAESSCSLGDALPDSLHSSAHSVQASSAQSVPAGAAPQPTVSSFSYQPAPPVADPLLAATKLVRPHFVEGELAWQALQGLAQSARREISEQRTQNAEYREYIEGWVHEIKTPLAAQRLMLENMHDVRLRPYEQELSRVEQLVEQTLFFARSFSLENDYLIRLCALDDLVQTALKSRAKSLIAAMVHVDFEGLYVPTHQQENFEGLYVPTHQPGDLEGPDATTYQQVDLEKQDVSSVSPVNAIVPKVPCDPKWMVFILGQLIDNAVKYRMPERAAKLSFYARVFNQDTANERVELSIEDNGVGISQADIVRIFERGFTGTNGRQTSHSTGLGLYLAQQLCQKMGLTLRAESLQGQWTRFIISFPRQGLEEWL